MRIDDRTLVARLISQARYEIFPSAGIVERTRSACGPEVPLAVTCSRQQGIDRSVRVATELLELGHDVVPHLAARLVRDRDHLRRLLAGLTAAGARELLAIGGDEPTARGCYESASELLEAVSEISPELRLEVAGYPEGHPGIPEELLWQALAEKASRADAVVTQLCFDAAAVISWQERAQARVGELPVVVGIAGPVEPLRLLRFAGRIGVGQSLGFARKNRGLLRRLANRNRYDPAAVLEPLLPLFRSGTASGLHVYTFNQLAAAMEWRRTQARRARSLPAAQEDRR